MKMSRPILITTTCDQREILENISNALVDSRLAACCQISGPVTSIYRWKGKTENAQEFICSIKSISDRLDQIVTEIRRLHGYDEPEIVATEITGGSESYLEWIKSEVA